MHGRDDTMVPHEQSRLQMLEKVVAFLKANNSPGSDTRAGPKSVH